MSFFVIPWLVQANVIAIYDRAVSLIAQGRSEKAEAEFTKLLSFAPDFFPDAEISPKVREPFLKARAQYFFSPHYRCHWQAQLIKAVANNGSINLLINASSELLSLVRTIVVNLKHQDQHLFRSISLSTPENFSGAINFEYLTTPGMKIDFYIEFIGSYDAVFSQIGSAYVPLVLTIPELPITPPPIPAPEKFIAFRAGWPIAVGTIIALLGTFTYGLLKIKR